MFTSPWQKPARGMQINKAHPLAKGLAGCYIINEATGDKLFDLSGNDNGGTNNGADWVAGGLDFVSGNNDYVNLSRLGNFGSKIENDFAISIKLKSSQSTNIGLFGGFDTSQNSIFVRLNEAPDGTDDQLGRIRIYCTPTGSATDAVIGGVNTDSGITDGNIHNLFINFKPLSNILEIWIDGVGQAITYTTQTHEGDEDYPNFAQDMYLGALNVDGSISTPMTGTIYNAYIYEGARTESDVAWLNREPYAMFEQPISPASLYYEAPIGVTIPVLMHHYNQMMRA